MNTNKLGASTSICSCVLSVSITCSVSTEYNFRSSSGALGPFDSFHGRGHDMPSMSKCSPFQTTCSLWLKLSVPASDPPDPSIGGTSILRCARPDSNREIGYLLNAGGIIASKRSVPSVPVLLLRSASFTVTTFSPLCLNGRQVFSWRSSV